MKMISARISILVLLLSLTLGACNPVPSQAATPTETRLLPTETPTPTAAPTLTPTVTPVMVQVEATVWTEEPLVPILTLHKFKTDGDTPSDFNGMKLQLEDFRSALQGLYEAGFSLVSLDDWLAGKMVLPVGRRPLVLSMDDLFYTNQILLDENGNPEPDTGIGAIWELSQEHPDFGFHMALFIVLGDKYFPFDPQYGNEPRYKGRDWETELAQTIAWCIEHDAMVYNHTFKHGYLGGVPNPISIESFIGQLARNDDYLRQLLTRIGREDLIPQLGNIVALTGGIPPQSNDDWEELEAYQNPEGKPLQAVLGIYSAPADPSYWQYLTRPYDPDFDPYDIMRIVANLPNMQYLAENSADFPAAQSCTLYVEESQQDNDSFLSGQIQATIAAGNCPAGLYVLDGKLFDARTEEVFQIVVQTNP